MAALAIEQPARLKPTGEVDVRKERICRILSARDLVVGHAQDIFEPIGRHCNLACRHAYNVREGRPARENRQGGKKPPVHAITTGCCFGCLEITHALRKR